MAGTGNLDRALRAACRLAVAVALEGEVADPPVPAPPALRPVLGFSRLSAAAYAVIGRVIDEDGTFRARVAERADEADVGRAGWLWLHRPVDWADDPVFQGGGAGPGADASEGGRGGDERDRTAKLRKQVAELQAERKRLAGEVGELRRSLAEAEAAQVALEEDLARLREERNAAVRGAKALEADLAEARRERRVARAATLQAEAELAALRAGPGEGGVDAPVDGPADGPAGERADGPAGGSDPPRARSGVEPAGGGGASDPGGAHHPAVPLDEVASQVSAAADAAAELARALASVAGLVQSASPDGEPLAGDVEGAGADAGRDAGPGRSAGSGRRGSALGQRPAGTRRRSGPRRPAVLPAGIFDGTPEAVRHLITSPENLLVVDGYNLARAAWSGLAPEEERRRTVALLEEVQARSNGTVVVAFDGDGSVVAPLASKHVRVRFSTAGQTADELIGELVSAQPVTQPVVVVSSDREVRADAERLGATSVGSEHLLRACGR